MLVVWLILAPEKTAAISADFFMDMTLLLLPVLPVLPLLCPFLFSFELFDDEDSPSIWSICELDAPR